MNAKNSNRVIRGIVLGVGAILIFLIGGVIGGYHDGQILPKPDGPRDLVQWYVLPAVAALVVLLALHLGLKRTIGYETLPVLAGILGAVIAGFGGLLAMSLVVEQNALLRAQNRAVEQAEVNELFLLLRTRYQQVRKPLPSPTQRARVMLSERELCDDERLALEEYWLQAFLEWYLLKGFPAKLREAQAEGGSREKPREENSTATEKTLRDELYEGFYEPAFRESLRQPLMVQALASMLEHDSDLFGGKGGESPHFLSGMADLYAKQNPPKKGWSSFEKVTPRFKNIGRALCNEETLEGRPCNVSVECQSTSANSQPITTPEPSPSVDRDDK